ncbi:TolB-like protein [Shimia isoporae]|uniref:TolB-like protein n=1 Tax=Shimia isoporae TaxID=647720 RepID=A0A4R1NPA4_9RHOB|nr:hypothetical protein [Shimia isoporae]TCL08463.1 TolB-like protein [Shimia isoporae]
MTQTVDPKLVFEQMHRITGAQDFAPGKRTRQFLEHIITEELEGRGDRLKGTALAMDLFGRSADFDPASDPVVRTEAMKLRKALEHYYLTEGAQDQIYIDVPKGSYRPVITLREIDDVQASDTKHPNALPLLSVCRFEGDHADNTQLYREGLPGEIALELAKFGHIRVRDVSAAQTEPDLTQGYALQGKVHAAGTKVRIVLQLSRQPDRQIIWSDRFVVDADEADVFALQETIAKACATELADAYGALGEDVAASYAGRDRKDASVFGALLSFHAHMRTSSVDSLSKFEDLSNRALVATPESGLAHALVALCQIEKVALGLADFASLEGETLSHAETAVALSPKCQEALFAAAVSALLRHDKTEFESLLSRAVNANPNGALLSTMVGAWIAMSGELERGCELIRRAQETNAHLPAWSRIPLALQRLDASEFQSASKLVDNLDARDVAIEWALLAAIHGSAGNERQKQGAMDRLNELGANPSQLIAALPLEPKLKAKLLPELSPNNES